MLGSGMFCLWWCWGTCLRSYRCCWNSQWNRGCIIAKSVQYVEEKSQGIIASTSYPMSESFCFYTYLFLLTSVECFQISAISIWPSAIKSDLAQCAELLCGKITASIKGCVLFLYSMRQCLHAEYNLKK